jgi:nucleoside-diphosphate-sugar epimerase
MKVLVIGSEGYLGRPFCRRLVSRGHRVWGVDALLRGNGPSPLKRFAKGFRHQVEVLRSEDPLDVVVDLAASAHTVDGRADRETYLVNNAISPLKLFEHVRSLDMRFVVPSSLSVYAGPDDHYPYSKLELERGLLKRGFDPRLTILRFGTIYGVDETDDYEGGSYRPHLLLNSMLRDAICEGVIRYTARVRPVCNIQLALDALQHAVERPGPHGEIRNVWDCVGTCEQFAKLVSTIEPAELEPADSADTRDYGADWAPHRPAVITAALHRTARWIRNVYLPGAREAV